MSTYFISSVVKDFEQYREAAKSAVGLLSGTPVMSESFGAREHSSEQVCLSEIEQSDVFLLILGSSYGYITPAGISVTHAEFNHARSLRKKILVFVQKTDMDDQQIQFKKVVEDYSEGFFRASFENSAQLKDEVIRGIAQLNASLSASTEDEFLGYIKQSKTERYGRDESYLRLSYWPQPIRKLHLPDLDKKIDSYFIKLCEAGFASLNEGFTTIDDGRRDGYMGIQTKKSSLKIFENSLTIVQTSNLNTGNNGFAFFAVSPSVISNLAKSAINLNDSNSVWCEIGLTGIENKTFKDQEPNQHSYSVSGSGIKEVSETKLFQPVGVAAYESWINIVIEKWQRKLSR